MSTTLFPARMSAKADSSARQEAALDVFFAAAKEMEGGLPSTPPNTMTCPTCNVPREDWTFDDLSLCGTCGTVMERPIDSGAEYRFFGLEERGGGDPCRVGAPMDTRFPTSGLGTMILSHAQGGNSSTRIAQRFGSAANLNVHFHCLALDGVYRVGRDGRPRFVAATAPTQNQVQAL